MRQDMKIHLGEIELGILEEYLLSNSMEHVVDRNGLCVYYNDGEFGHHSVTVNKNANLGSNVVVNGKDVEKIVEFYRKAVVKAGLEKVMGD